MREKGRPNDDVRDYIRALAPRRVTEREAEVARFIAWHFSNTEISEELRIEVSTVKTYVEHLLMKLGVGNRGNLAGEVRLIVDAYRVECERKRQAAEAALRLVGKKKPRKAARATDGPERHQQA